MKTDPLRIGARTARKGAAGNAWPGVQGSGDVRMTTVYIRIPAVHDCSIQRAKQ